MKNKAKFLKSISVKVISCVLALSLVFAIGPGKSKVAYAAEGTKTRSFIPTKVIKEDITIGDTKAKLVGHFGIEIEVKKGSGKYETFYSSYELIPKIPGTYFDGKSYWNADGYIVNVLRHDVAEGIQFSLMNHLTKATEDFKNYDWWKLDNKLKDSSLPFEDFDNGSASFMEEEDNIITGAIAGAIFTVVGSVLGGGCIAYLIYAAGLVEDVAIFLPLIGSALGVVLAVVGVVMCITAIYQYLNSTAPKWKNGIDKLGFTEDRKGLLNIGKGWGDDDGLGVLWMHDDYVLADCSVEWDKGDNTYKLKGDEDHDTKCNRIIICGGISTDHNENRLKEHQPYFYCMTGDYNKLKADVATRLIKEGYISYNDISNIIKAWEASFNLDLEPSEAGTRRDKIIKDYVSLKNIIIEAAPNDVLGESNVPDDIIQFYKNALIHLKENQYDKIYQEAKEFSESHKTI